MIRPASRVE